MAHTPNYQSRYPHAHSQMWWQLPTAIADTYTLLINKIILWTMHMHNLTEMHVHSFCPPVSLKDVSLYFVCGGKVHDFESVGFYWANRKIKYAYLIKYATLER